MKNIAKALATLLNTTNPVTCGTVNAVDVTSLESRLVEGGADAIDSALDIRALAKALFYGVSWDESQPTGGYTRTGTLAGIATGSSPSASLIPIQAAMRRCILNDNGVVQYYLDPINSYNRLERTPTIIGADDAGVAYKVSDAVVVTGIDDAGVAYKVSDAGMFTEAESVYVGKYVHNTTDNTYALITAKDSNDVLSISADIMANLEGFKIGVLSAPVADYVGHYVHNTTDGTYAMITAKDDDATLSIASDIMANGEGFEICTAVLNGDDGQVMVQIPKFYHRYSYSGTTHTSEISLYPLTDFSVHHDFIKNDEILDYQYYSAYEGTLYDDSRSAYANGVQLTAGSTDFTAPGNTIHRDGESNPFSLLEVGDKIVIAGATDAGNNGTKTVSVIGDATITVAEALVASVNNLNVTIETEKDFANDKLCSISGKAPINYATRANFRALADNRNPIPSTGWRQQTFDNASAIQLLYLIEYADWDSQSMIGAGLTDWGSGTWDAWNDYNPIEKTGNSNGDGNATANNSAGDGNTGSYMSYRGIENFFGHLWKWVDGFNINANVPYICNNDSDFADNTVTNYTALGVTMVNANGYVVTLEQTDRGFLPASIGGSTSTYLCDYYWQLTGWRVAKLGGSANFGLLAGVACWYVNYSSGCRYRYVAGRLAF